MSGGNQRDKLALDIWLADSRRTSAPNGAPSVTGRTGMSRDFIVGDEVSISSPGHRHDGRTGKVSYLSEFWGTVGVSIDGSDYGFLRGELTPIANTVPQAIEGTRKSASEPPNTSQRDTP